ncbi:transcriptional regulator ATRX homolog isoform X2 [Tribolium madens]|uniref:transcriptional regulator ATRX homolog isoform X2 n=1 Tax=Tribolium madens TaxID=41895 RepID=UPI001CF738F1|nr:transcriptional regulator ATRX homolog isoform X2 [Tribolium madens]
MSRESLNEVLDKFAQVTVVLVETSKIKEQLEKSSSDEKLQAIIEQTEVQVNSLVKHATSVKELFDKKMKTAEKLLANGVDINKNTEMNDDLSTPANGENEPEMKPKIKLVDINKLVEPREKPEKTVRFDDTVVLITSSDEKSDDEKLTEPPLIESVGKRKAAAKTIKKTRQSLQVCTSTSSSSESSDDTDFITTTKPRRSKNLNKTTHENRFRKKKTVPMNKIVLSDTDSSEDLETVKLKNSKIKEKKKPKKVEEKKTSDEESDNEPAFDWKNDPKFKLKCYVKLIRIPCEKLKEHYLGNLELLEIKKLTDLNSLHKKRRRSGSDSSTSSENTNRKKRKRKTTKNQENSEKGNSSDATISDLDEGTNGSPLSEVQKNPDLAKGNSDTELAEDALNLLNSDKEGSDDKEDTPGENPENSDVEHSGQNTAEKDMENMEHVQPPEGASDDPLQIEKESQNVDKPEEAPEKNSTNETNENEQDNTGKDDNGSEKTNDDQSEKEANEKSEENSKLDENKVENNSGKKWRKDKLLTSKLSSSDSEEEFAKFRRKKEKMNEEVGSDDEPKLPKDKKKRLMKKRIKKAILSDSDSDKKDSCDDFQQESSSSSSDSEEEKEKKREEEKSKPARKRVKRVKDSSEDDDEEKSTRKQIRNIWGRDSLAETTKQAEAEEKERKARILEKQKKYNQIYEFSSQLNAKVEKVVLDFDEKNQKELLKVDDCLVSKLKPHQASGVQFMWDACFESLERAKTTKGSGCILAHCMGLGKTLQVITLSHTLLTNSDKTNVRKILVVSPLNTVLNWVSEFKQWLPDCTEYEVYELVSFKQNYERQYQVKNWHDYGGVLIIGYDMFRNLSNPESKRLSKKMRSVFQEALVDPGPDLVICDEGHLLKNEKTNTSIAMNRLKTLRRIVLTGTPLQNNLKEYFCMVQFVKPNLLGTYKEYLNRFVNPITNGQYTDSTPHDIQIMRKRSHVLHKMLDGVVQRRDYSVLEPYLPPKHEYVLFLSLTETQIKLYQHYMDRFARTGDGSNRTSFLFVDFQALQRICTHPRVLLDKSIEMKLAREKRDDESEESEGSLKDFINDDEDDETTPSSNSSSDEGGEKKTAAPKKRLTRATAALAKENGEPEEVVALEDPVKKEWWQEYCDGDELNNIAHSSKLFLLFEILKECEQIGDKVLVFSQSLYSLNIIEYFLGRIHDATQAGETDSVGGYSGSWCLGLDYFRLDGSSSCDSRSIWCKTFNNPTNTRARLFLISTKAGGLGINLVAANRVIIFDVSWNPSHDIQSIYRVYRFGQTKPCYIYRFVTLGTMEMKIYERQVTKQAISKRVIDEQQIDRHYNQNDLAELYKFDPKPGERPIPLVPKDVLLGELLQKFEDRIYKYHEHQTLLENKEAEGLNEEERKAAWEEFENEKKQRHNYLGNSYLRAANVQVALANLLRKENPSLNETQIKEMLPILQSQMQEQVTRGDLTLYKRVQHELQMVQAIQNQRLKEQFYQQQALRMLQQQKMPQQLATAMNYQNAASWLEQYMNQLPGTSRAPPVYNPNDVIDLND